MLSNIAPYFTGNTIRQTLKRAFKRLFGLKTESTDIALKPNERTLDRRQSTRQNNRKIRQNGQIWFLRGFFIARC